MKGISPLVAAILLIAFTVAIAGILATWADKFTKGKLAEIEPSTACLGALDINSVSFSGGTISARMRNLGRNVNLSNFVTTLEYSDGEPFKIYPKKEPYPIDSSVPQFLSPGDIDFISIPTGDDRKPSFVRIAADPCIGNEAIASIP